MKAKLKENQIYVLAILILIVGLLIIGFVILSRTDGKSSDTEELDKEEKVLLDPVELPNEYMAAVINKFKNYDGTIYLDIKVLDRLDENGEIQPWIIKKDFKKDIIYIESLVEGSILETYSDGKYSYGNLDNEWFYIDYTESPAERKGTLFLTLGLDHYYDSSMEVFKFNATARCLSIDKECYVFDMFEYEGDEIPDKYYVDVEYSRIIDVVEYTPDSNDIDRIYTYSYSNEPLEIPKDVIENAKELDLSFLDEELPPIETE